MSSENIKEQSERNERSSDRLLKVLYTLLKHSDENNKLKKKDIMNLVQKDFDLDNPVSRNAVNNAIEDIEALMLKEDNPFGELRYGSEANPDRLTGIYIAHLIKDHELRFIIDMVSSCEYIPLNERKDIVERLCCLSSEHIYSDYKSYIRRKTETTDVKKTEFSEKMKIIHTAVARGYQITFNRVERQSDKKFTYEMKDGKIKQYTAHPYRTIFNDGFYYLICGISKDGNKPGYISNYRIDRMDNVELTRKPVYPETDIPGVPKNADTKKYISTHRMMWSGEVKKFRFRSLYITEVIDFFGDDCRVLPGNPGGPFTVEVETTEYNMLVFARRFFDFIEIIDPPETREKMKKELFERYQKYCEEI